MRDAIDHDLVDLLLCAADLARLGDHYPLSRLAEHTDGALVLSLYEARTEAMAVAPRVFEYRNDLLADTLLEAAYRVAEGRGIGGVA